MKRDTLLGVGAATIILLAAGVENSSAKVTINSYPYLKQAGVVYKIDSGLILPPLGIYRPDNKGLNTIEVRVSTSELVGIPGLRIFIDDAEGNQVYEYSELDGNVIAIAKNKFDFSHKIPNEALEALEPGKYYVSTEIVNRGSKDLLVAETFSVELAKGQFSEISRIEGGNTTSATVRVNPALRGNAAQIALSRLNARASQLLQSVNAENSLALQAGLKNHPYANNYQVVTRGVAPAGLVLGASINGTSTAFDSTDLGVAAKNYLVSSLASKHGIALNPTSNRGSRVISSPDGSITINFSYGWVPARGVNILK